VHSVIVSSFRNTVGNVVKCFYSFRSPLRVLLCAIVVDAIFFCVCFTHKPILIQAMGRPDECYDGGLDAVSPFLSLSDSL
jgi:hypothetical protein